MSTLLRKGSVTSTHVTALTNEQNRIANNALLNGLLLSDVEVTSERVNKIRHKLGRKLLGWIVVMNGRNDIAFYDTQKDNPAPENELWLFPGEVAGASTFTISLWVF